jgi:anaerobic ribonucleoside-triphosphate reductase activating protein
MITMSVAHIVPCTEAEGPGKRFALWFQGCPLRCPGCCNPEYLPFQGGTRRTVVEVVAEMVKIREETGIEGITLLGGEPFAHAEPAAALAVAAQKHGLTVMVFSGYTIEHLRTTIDPHTTRLLAHTDILVDGPYLRDVPDHTRRWIGSTNQRIHFLSHRYRADDECWKQRNTLEIRVRRDSISVNGFPATEAVGLWKGWKRKTPKGTTNKEETG